MNTKTHTGFLTAQELVDAMTLSVIRLQIIKLESPTPLTAIMDLRAIDGVRGVYVNVGQAPQSVTVGGSYLGLNFVLVIRKAPTTALQVDASAWAGVE